MLSLPANSATSVPVAKPVAVLLIVEPIEALPVSHCAICDFRELCEAQWERDDHLVGVECSTEEEISRQEYDETIAEPLRKTFTERKWWIL